MLLRGSRLRKWADINRDTERFSSFQLRWNRCHRLIRIPLLLAFVVLAGAENQPSLPPELTLAEALNIALSNSTVLRTAQANLEQASGAYQQSHSELLPHIDVFARQSFQTVNLIGLGIPVTGETGVIGPFGSMDARAFLRQDLINIANLRAQESYHWQQESSRLLLNDARELVTLNVVATYLLALNAKASRDTLAEQTKLAEDLYQITRQRVTAGAAAELDAIRSMEVVNALEQQRQEAEHGYIAAKLSLASVIHAQITSTFEVADPAAYGPSVMPMAPDFAISAALALRPDYRAAVADVSAAELRVRSIKASRLPTVRMTFDDGQSGNSPVNNVNTYRIQGSIAFPVYTGGRIKGEIEEAEGALSGARAALDEDRSRIQADVLTALSGVEWALKEVDTSSRNVMLSRQELELSRQRFVQGIADNTEVVNAQNRLSQADAAQIRAQYTLGLARANLARATGAAEKTYRK